MVYIYGNMQMLMGNPTSWDRPTGINGLSCSGHYDCWGKKQITLANPSPNMAK